MDASVLVGALADDLDAAFEWLVRAREDRLFSIALRLLGDRAEAEDAAQDAFVRAYRALAMWDPARIRDLRLDAWLATIVVNAARTRARRRATTGRHESLTFLDARDHPAAGAGETPPGRLSRREATDAWARRLLALPERYRGPVVLRHVDGLGYDEIALALDRPEGTVKAQVHRGLALLRAALESEVRADALADGDGRPNSDLVPAHSPTPRLKEVAR